MDQVEHVWAAISRSWPPYLRDRLTLGLLFGGLLLNLGFWLWLIVIYRSIPQFVPLHFDVAGNPDRIVPRSEVFVLPTIGSLVYLANTAVGVLLRRRVPFAGYLLWGGTAVVQMLLIGAALQIVR